jgi:hypothetical protein
VSSLIERLPPPVAATARWGVDHSNVVMFVAGFLFDVLTIQRIDSRADLGIQLLYLLALTALIVFQHREATGSWTPPPLIRRWWPYNVEVLHFFYGGLLSAYVVLYFRSSTGARPLVFFMLLVAMFLLNEMPQVRQAGHRLRLGLFAFCVLSFFNYFVPIAVGRMGGWVFLATLVSAAAVVWVLADRLALNGPEHAAERARLFAPGVVVFAVVGMLYVMKLIPPVPLSVTFQGIYHDVRRHEAGYRLVYEQPDVWRFWRHDSRPFRARTDDRIHYFVRVFAPARFSERIVAHWEFKSPSGWRTTDRIELPMIRGGREDGWRTFARKATFQPGRWRVTAETDDGRAIATMSFDVEQDTRTDERVLLMREG